MKQAIPVNHQSLPSKTSPQQSEESNIQQPFFDKSRSTVLQRINRTGESLSPKEHSVSSQPQKNNTGLPDHVKSGVEHLSGISMDDVKVHYNSAKPSEMQAHAYAQGNDIHIAPGQEKYLPHEAWHVVQQKQGRVQPTMQMQRGENINDNEGLEKEADVMGNKATQLHALPEKHPDIDNKNMGVTQLSPVIQRAYYLYNHSTKDYTYYLKPARVTLGITPFKDSDGKVIKHKNYDTWVTVQDWAKIELERKKQAVLETVNVVGESEVANEIMEEAKNLNEKFGLLENVNVPNYETIPEILRVQVLTFGDALNNFMKKNVLKMILAMFAGAGFVGLALWLETITLFAPWLGIATTALSSLYSVYLVWRWTQQELLPVFLRAPMIVVNMGIFMMVIGKMIFDLTQGTAFKHMVMAAVPFALVLEHILVKILEKIERSRLENNELAKPGGESQV